jgi:hypothetical protein
MGLRGLGRQGCHIVSRARSHPTLSTSTPFLCESIDAVGAAHHLMVIEGACLLKVCDRLGIQVDRLVYVVGPRCDGIRLREEGAEWDYPSLPPRGLDKEVLDYHNEHLPHSKADVVYHRKES